MVATVILSESNGSGEIVTDDISNINFGSIDAPNLNPVNHPIVAGENSYVKYIRLKASGTFNKIDNLKVWKSSGDYVTGETLQTNLRTSAYIAASYATPSTASFNDQTMPTSKPATSNLGISGSLTGSLTSTGYSDYWKIQKHTTISTPAGDTNTLTFTIEYDEQ